MQCPLYIVCTSPITFIGKTNVNGYHYNYHSVAYRRQKFVIRHQWSHIQT